MMVQLVGMSLMDSSLGRGFGGGTRCVDCQSFEMWGNYGVPLFRVSYP